MIHIEKLSLKNIGKYSWQTFVDHFIGNKEYRQYYLELKNDPRARGPYINSERLSSALFQQTPNICLGKYFGLEGIDIDALLVNGTEIENLVVEMSPEHFSLLLKTKNKLKQLLENYTVILNDFEESGTLFGRDQQTLVQLLSKLNIQPKQLFLVGGCFEMHDYPKLNIFKIQFDYWLSATPMSNNFYLDAIFDTAYKQSLLDRLDEPPRNFCVIPIFKPRLHRIRLLSYIDRLGILSLSDWSFGYNLRKHILSHKTKNIESLTEEETAFLSKYEFPRLFPNLETTWASVCSPETEWFNKYRFYICAETYIGDEFTNEMGSIGFISEKTYKSFLIGAAPLIYSAKNSDEYLKTLGFRTISYGIDNTDFVSIGDLIYQASLDRRYELELIKHNFELITDKAFLVSQIAAPLNKIADLINSIRR